MPEIKLQVTRTVVITGRGPDRISLDLNAPTGHPTMKYQPCATFECAAGYGLQWCREVLGLEPDEIINLAS